MTLTLSTGYDVLIELSDPREGLQHLARALMGEVMFPKLKRTTKTGNKHKGMSGWTPGLHAVKNEILKIINKMEGEDLWLLVIAVMWAYLMGEFDRISRDEAGAN